MPKPKKKCTYKPLFTKKKPFRVCDIGFGKGELLEIWAEKHRKHVELSGIEKPHKGVKSGFQIMAIKKSQKLDYSGFAEWLKGAKPNHFAVLRADFSLGYIVQWEPKFFGAMVLSFLHDFYTNKRAHSKAEIEQCKRFLDRFKKAGQEETADEIRRLGTDKYLGMKYEITLINAYREVTLEQAKLIETLRVLKTKLIPNGRMFVSCNAYALEGYIGCLKAAGFVAVTARPLTEKDAQTAARRQWLEESKTAPEVTPYIISARRPL